MTTLDELHITLTNGDTYSIPVSVIARDRAAYYAHEFDDDIQRSLDEDTLPLFADDDYGILDWASSNMNWSDVAEFATLIESRRKQLDLEDEWSNCDKEVIRVKN